MKRRMLSLIVTVAMVLGLAVTMAFAQDGTDAETVATVGETAYATLAEAVAKAKTGPENTVVLTHDATLTEKLTIDQDVTIQGNGNTIFGQPDNKGVYIEVTGGTFALSDVTLKDFGGTVSGASGEAVIKVPATAAAATVVNATNVNVSNFSRSAYDIRSGSFAITGGSIDCTNGVAGGSNSKLTKGILVGLGSSKVTGSITGVNVTMSASNYADWNTAAIEVYNNANVTIDGCSISNVENGIHVDNYYGSAGQDVSVTVSNTTVTATGDAVKLYSTYNGQGGVANASLTVASGTYTGDVRIVGATDKDTLALTGGTYYVADEDELKDVLSHVAAQGQQQVTVQLTKDVTLSSMLNITASNVVVDLGGNTITAGDTFAYTFDNDKHLVQVLNGANVTLRNGRLETTTANKHALNVYGAENFLLKDVVVDHTLAEKGAPVVVNGSTMSVGGTVELITGANSWYAMNVDNQVNGVATPSEVTFVEGANVQFSGVNPLGIYLETTHAGTEVAVSFEKNVTLSSDVENFVAVSIKKDANAKVENPENAGLDTDKNGNLVPHEHVFGDAWVSDETGHWHACACGEKQDVAQHTFQWVVDKEATATENGSKHEECTVCGYAKQAVVIPATGTTQPSEQPSTQPSEQPSQTQKPDAEQPQTGDVSNVALWVAMMFVSVATLTGVMAYTKKRA